MATSITNTSVTTDNLTVDTNTIHVDSTNNRVGIGTASPLSELHQDIGLNDREGHYLYYGADAKAGFTVLPITGEIRIGAATAGTSGNYSTEIMSRNGSNLVTSIKADNYGRVTKPNQPSFWAYCSADTNINVNSGTPVQFDSERFDVGSNFDTSTYTFTAPVTGKYFLSAGCRIDLIDTAASYYRLRMLVSNKEVGSIIDPNFSADLNYYTRDISSVFDMDANDTASVNVLQSAGHTSSHVNNNDVYTWFAGYLLG